MMLAALALSAVAPLAGALPAASTVPSAATLGATPMADDRSFVAFGGVAGIDRLVDRFVDLNSHDPRIGDIFRGQDLPHLRAMLKAQFCAILGGGCVYSGRSMAEAHKNLGLQMKDMNALVDNLQRAMAAEHVPFAAQNRLLARLAPMKRDVVVR